MRLASLVLLLAFLGAANALALHSNVDHVSIRGTEGKVYFWIVNTDGIAKTVAFNADLGELNGFFEDDGVILPERGSKGTWLKFWAPLCFRGTERIGVSAEVCDGQGNCEILRKTVLIAANPPEHCTDYFDQRVAVDPFVPPRSYGDGSPAWSNIAYSSYFDPTDFSVDILGSGYCLKLKPGEAVKRPFSLVNRGAASTFELRAAGAENEIVSFVSPRSVDLHRGESEEVWVNLQPKWVEGGRNYVYLQVLRRGQVVAEEPVCIDVEEVFEAQVRMPNAVSGKQCEEISFQGVVENKGTSADSFEIMVGRNALATPDYLQVNAGESAVFSVSIIEGSLNAGENDFLVTAKSSAKGIAGQALVKVNAVSCAPALPSETVEQKDNVVEITVAVANDFDSPLEKVTASVEGIPEQWTVESTVVNSIAPGETQTVVVKLTQTTSEEASAPVLVVKSESGEIARKPLSPIKPAGITGLFTSLSQNSLLIGLLIIGALAVLVLYSRYSKRGEGSFKESVKTKFAAMKNAAASK